MDVLSGPMYLRTYVREECVDGERTGSETQSDTITYINLDGLVMGILPLCGPIHLRPYVSKECVDGEGEGSEVLSGTKKKSPFLFGGSLRSFFLTPVQGRYCTGTGSCHGRCTRTMERGIEIHVLDDVNRDTFAYSNGFWV
jgi:hypothetical protein